MSKYGVFSVPCFPVFRLNTEIYLVNLSIKSECGKKGTRKNSLFEHFLRSENSINIISNYNIAPENILRVKAIAGISLYPKKPTFLLLPYFTHFVKYSNHNFNLVTNKCINKPTFRSRYLIRLWKKYRRNRIKDRTFQHQTNNFLRY